ncbi:type III-B CRISPR module RAMP protein Cmr1 [Amphibacillus cookii]|uniref:type III-B CRISPR module RAMP protein Cmr1 n=1 Tax=Amphibacillus cookii TaxID=767787 RepID=UPI001959EFE0|nr:CRISPR-associated protein Cmr1 [Amphibacillus cookii]
MKLSQNVPNLTFEKLEETLNTLKERADKTKESLNISIITHMFGGGTKAGEVDKDIPVRATSIRGNLRFWWRATRGANYTSVKSLKEAEAKIFGDTNRPSAVKILVNETGEAKWTPILQRKNNRTWELHSSLSKYKYVLFPFEDRKRDKHQDHTNYLNADSPYTFKLHLEYIQFEADNINIRDEVHAALWAWINFGGLGARTRRGCGSLYCKSFSPPKETQTPETLKQWFADRVKKYKLKIDSTSRKEWPTLQQIFIKSSNSKLLSSLQAWQSVVSHYSQFRRLSNGKRGRSHWSEPDSIRHMTRMAEEGHKTSVTIEKEDANIAFPRAQFGLPVIFQFHSKDRQDPFPTILKPRGKDRLASRLIIKAVGVSERSAFPIVVTLNQPEIEEVELSLMKEVKTKKQKEVKEQLDKYKGKLKRDVVYPKNLNYQKYPMKESTSAVEAFIKEGGSIWERALPEKP